MQSLRDVCLFAHVNAFHLGGMEQDILPDSPSSFVPPNMLNSIGANRKEIFSESELGKTECSVPWGNEILEMGTEQEISVSLSYVLFCW